MSEIASTQDDREAQEAKLRVEELRSQVNYHDYRYHVLDSPEIADFDYDNGYNNFDVRHTFNFSLLYQIPYGRGRSQNAGGAKDWVLGGWDIGGIYNARSGLPINMLVVRPDVLYFH